MSAVREAARQVLGRAGPASAVVGATDARVAALTYDDGPDPVWTPRLLEVLAGAGVHATFFVLASRARAHPQVLRETCDAGHEIALHGPDHQDPAAFTPPQLRRRTLDARAEIEDLSGCAVRYYRPPYMSIGLPGCLALAGTGLTIVGYGTTVHDWEPGLTDDDRVDRWAAGFGAGGVTLAHDAWPGPADGVSARPAPAVDRVRLAREMLRTASERGIPLTTVTALLEDGSRPRRDLVASLRATHLGPYLRRSGSPG